MEQHVVIDAKHASDYLYDKCTLIITYGKIEQPKDNKFVGYLKLKSPLDDSGRIQIKNMLGVREDMNYSINNNMLNIRYSKIELLPSEGSDILTFLCARFPTLMSHQGFLQVKRESVYNKYIQQCVRNIENLLYECGGYTFGSWVYEVVIPRISKKMIYTSIPMHILVTWEQYTKFLKLLEISGFVSDEFTLVSEDIRRYATRKINDTDGEHITDMIMFIVDDIGKFEDISINMTTAQKDKIISSPWGEPDIMSQNWQNKVASISSILFEKLKYDYTFANRINEEYLSKGWKISLNDELIKFDDKLKVLYLSSTDTNNLKNRVKELEETLELQNKELVLMKQIMKKLESSDNEFSRDLYETGKVVKIVRTVEYL